MNEASTPASRLAALQSRIDEACRAAGRTADQITLLAVGKTFPMESILQMAVLGQRRFGENYVQEALAKISACRLERPDLNLEWHFIGPIQSNKTRPIAENFDWVHSVDREKIARRLSEQRPAGLAPLQVCLQVNIGDEESKSGCEPGEAPGLAKAIAAMPGLRLRGLMAIPKPQTDVAAQRRQFAMLRAIFEDIRAAGLALDTLSMGMSDDLEAAVAEGATMIRVGSALFGRRQANAPLAGAA